MDRGQLVTRLKSLGGFDITDTQAVDELNVKYVEMVVGAKWRKSARTLATTTTGQANYDLPAADIYVDLLRLGTARYQRLSQREMWDLQDGSLRLESWARGGFAQDWDANGNPQIELNPVPDATGTTIEAIVVLAPDPLAADDDVPIVPEDFHPYIADGAGATFLRELERRPDLADVNEQRFQAAVERLRRRANARVGSGPSQLQVAGYHW